MMLHERQDSTTPEQGIQLRMNKKFEIAALCLYFEIMANLPRSDHQSPGTET